MAVRFDATVDETACCLKNPGATDEPAETSKKNYGVTGVTRQCAQIIILPAGKLIDVNQKNAALMKSLAALLLELGRGE